LRVHSALDTVAAMDNVARAADMLKRVGRMVEGFLADLMETTPNDLDCLELERIRWMRWSWPCGSWLGTSTGGKGWIRRWEPRGRMRPRRPKRIDL
jgi:hypothetical protein